MNLKETPLAGVFVADTSRTADARGSLMRLFCERELGPALQQRRIVQVNHTVTRHAGAVRGLHWQIAPYAEMKLVRCMRGRVWDVAVDLRAGSPTLFGWHAEELSAENNRMMVIPEGCAHGFQALEPDSEMLYLHTAPYAPSCEGGALHSDARLAIRWPLPVTDLSERDRSHRPIDAAYRGMST